MTLRLDNVSVNVDGKMHIHPTSLELQKGTMNVLLGPTLAGKTSLMRLMAGLDTPSTGAVFWDGADVTGARVQSRDVAMVYQQFVNYPSLSVYENIASPLRIQKKSKREIDAKVSEMAELLKLTDLLHRRPSEISGGQQQRCAIARALAKDVGLVLMDEPLANLDYKLREELRVEIPRLFAASGAIFVYATTEPEEALLLGGNTACLWEGRVTQFGPSAQVYREPIDEITARVYSDPPMNFVEARKVDGAFQIAGGQSIKVPEQARELPNGVYRAGFRAHHVKLGAGEPGHLRFEAQLITTELTGSDTFVHLSALGERWIGLVAGPQIFQPGEALPVSVDPVNIFYFNQDGRLACQAQAPAVAAAKVGA